MNDKWLEKFWSVLGKHFDIELLTEEASQEIIEPILTHYKDYKSSEEVQNVVVEAELSRVIDSLNLLNTETIHTVEQALLSNMTELENKLNIQKKGE